MDRKYELGQFIPLHYHYNMLLDPARMNSFKVAIDQEVQPGAAVVDLGGGTGVLSFFAAQKARKVYYVEYNPELVAEARRILPNNPNGDRVEIVHTDACRFVPDEPVDVVICEMLHVSLLREKQIEVINAFKKNYRDRYPSDPLPTFIPMATIQALQPVFHPFTFEEYFAPIPLFFDPYSESPDVIPLGDPAVYHKLLYDQPFGLHCRWNGTVPIKTEGTVNALRFITKNVLAAEPETRTLTEWHNHYLVLPLMKDIPVKNGDVLEISLAYGFGAPLTALKPEVKLR
jgi:predicted RNA methylase